MRKLSIARRVDWWQWLFPNSRWTKTLRGCPALWCHWREKVTTLLQFTAKNRSFRWSQEAITMLVTPSSLRQEEEEEKKQKDPWEGWNLMGLLSLQPPTMWCLCDLQRSLLPLKKATLQQEGHQAGAAKQVAEREQRWVAPSCSCHHDAHFLGSLLLLLKPHAAEGPPVFACWAQRASNPPELSSAVRGERWHVFFGQWAVWWWRGAAGQAKRRRAPSSWRRECFLLSTGGGWSERRERWWWPCSRSRHPTSRGPSLCWRASWRAEWSPPQKPRTSSVTLLQWEKWKFRWTSAMLCMWALSESAIVVQQRLAKVAPLSAHFWIFAATMRRNSGLLGSHRSLLNTVLERLFF